MDRHRRPRVGDVDASLLLGSGRAHILLGHAWRASVEPAEEEALRGFAKGVRALLGDDLRELRLFGSRARAEGTEESDVDVAVIVSSAGRARRHDVYDLAHDISMEHGLDIAAWVVEEERLDELRARERRIALDVDREGIRS